MHVHMNFTASLPQLGLEHYQYNTNLLTILVIMIAIEK